MVIPTSTLPALLKQVMFNPPPGMITDIGYMPVARAPAIYTGSSAPRTLETTTLAPAILATWSAGVMLIIALTITGGKSCMNSMNPKPCPLWASCLTLSVSSVISRRRCAGSEMAVARVTLRDVTLLLNASSPSSRRDTAMWVRRDSSGNASRANR